MTATLALSGWLAAAAAAIGARICVLRRREPLARACHEVRGALTAARLAIELGVRTGEFSPERVGAVELELGCAALALEDLAGGGRAAGMQVHRKLVNLESVLHDVFEAWRGLAVARRAELRLGSIPEAWLYADRLRLAQAAGNLVANAIEHGGGAIELSARDDGERVRIEVTDSGPGLSAPVAALAAGARRGRGLRGRGLAIASDIAAGHGGRLAAAPSERGARLVLELPACPAGSSLAAE